MIATARIIIGGVTCLGFVVLAATAAKHRNRPGTLSFAFLCSLLGAFSVLVALPVAVVSSLQYLRVGVFELLVVAWLLFTITYTGRGPVASTRLLSGLAGLLLFVIVTLLTTSLVSTEFARVLFATNYVIQSLTSALGIYGLLIAIRSAFVYDDLPSGGTLLVTTLGIGFVCLTVLITVASSANMRAALDGLLVVSSLVALSVSIIVHRQQVFANATSAGHLAREQVLDEMNTAVVIVDRAEQILDCNDAFGSLFGTTRRQAIGEPVDTVAGSLSTGEQEPVTTAHGSRVCDIEQTVLTVADGTQIGTAYRLRDVTARRTREQRLAVLNRVLRHNLRNDLDAMHGFAETVETEPASVDSSAIGSRIGDIASDLSEIGSTVERCETLLGRDHLTEQSVDLNSVVRDILAQLTDQYPGTGTLHVNDSVVVQTDPELLTAVLQEVIENGLKHGPGADTHVEITIRCSSGGATVAVGDNGPGIPKREQAVLLEGEESPLRHGSGVGLWLVNWGLSRLGGELAFDKNGQSGSVVTLTIPDSTAEL